jgi:Ca2+-binding RTX toxin-like protein
MRKPITIAQAALTALLIVGAPAAAQPPAVPGLAAAAARCFGEPATIVGSGIINGTQGDDVIVGSEVNDVINGNGGEDLICGLGGNDSQINGGVGEDRLAGGEGNDQLRGDIRFPRGSGMAAIGGDDDVLYGGAGADRMVGDSSGEPASGGGDDLMLGGDGDDSLIGDSIAFIGDAVGAGDDMLAGGAGFDDMIGDSEAFVQGDAIGSGGDDVLDLGADGGFLVFGDHNISDPAGGGVIGAGDDEITGGSNDEILVGDSSTVAFAANAGSDLIDGYGGNDRVFGDNVDFFATATFGVAGGEDALTGGTGDDTLRAGPGDDGLDGGGHTDDCDGEAGADSFTKCETVTGSP